MSIQSISEEYLASSTEKTDSPIKGQAGWECPSNIALVKYWGKLPGQIPANPSISLTLSKSVTRMNADYSISKKNQFNVEFTFHGRHDHLFTERIRRYFVTISPYMPFINNLNIRIDSTATFPHSAGIASSASAYGALALTVCSIEQKIKNQTIQDPAFYRKASFLARLGSGSACRSIYGGAVLWGFTPEFAGSSDEFALPVTPEINPEFRHYRDSILLVDTGTKELSSSAGHSLMEDHPYASCRYAQANANLIHILDVLNSGDIFGFNEVVETEALSLHALMMSSWPGFVLMKPNTLKILTAIKNYRSKTGMPVCYSMDAGANVHLLYPYSVNQEVKSFIDEHLAPLCIKKQVIHDQVGKGPVNLYRI